MDEVEKKIDLPTNLQTLLASAIESGTFGDSLNHLGNEDLELLRSATGEILDLERENPGNKHEITLALRREIHARKMAILDEDLERSFAAANRAKDNIDKLLGQSAAGLDDVKQELIDIGGKIDKTVGTLALRQLPRRTDKKDQN